MSHFEVICFIIPEMRILVQILTFLEEHDVASCTLVICSLVPHEF